MTLVEVLVVLSIIGVMAGLAVLSLGGASGGAGGGGEAEARRLADRLQRAADEALVTGVPRALVWEATGYRFLAWDPQDAAWSPEALPALAAAHALAGGLALAGPEGDAPVLVAADHAAPPVVLRLEGAGEAWVVAFDGLSARAEPGTR